MSGLCRALLGTLLLVLAALVAPPAALACDASKHAGAQKRRAPGRPPLAVGDSVMLGAVPQLARAGFEVDARGCRFVGQGLAVLRRRRRAGTLPRVVVLALGTNGSYARGDVGRALRILGRERLLVLVTPRELRGRPGRDARLLRAAGRRRPGRIRVLDWARYSAGRAGWFGADGIHLGPASARGFTRLLSRALRFRPPPEVPCP